MAETGLAAVCMEVTDSPAKNLQKHLRYMKLAHKQSAALTVFPELSLHGCTHGSATISEPLDCAAVSAISSKAREFGMYTIFGMAERGKSGETYNAAVLCGPNGIEVYRKVHLTPGERGTFVPGDGFRVFDTSIGKIGIIICYDKSFPESCRTLVLAGAQVIAVLSAWPLQGGQPYESDYKKRLFDLYDSVRAAENQCFVVSAAQTGGKEETYTGSAKIVGPDGVPRAGSGQNECLVCASADIPGEILRLKTDGGYDLLADRSPSTYRFR